MARWFVVLSVLAVVGCSGSPTQPTPVQTGQAFELRVGASATLSDGLQIRFDGVRADSRCPMDAICVWAGDGIVAVSLFRSPDRVERELHTQTSGSEVTYFDYSIKLTGLAPYPRSAQQIQPNDYVATLTVTRSGR